MPSSCTLGSCCGPHLVFSTGVAPCASGACSPGVPLQRPCHELQDLAKLAGCTVLLHIHGVGSLLAFLKHLAPLPLDSLCISAGKLTVQEQRLLSHCKARSLVS